MGRFLNVLAIVAGLIATKAHAIDIPPAGFAPMPAGTKMALFYYQSIEAKSFHLDGAGSVPASRLAMDVGIARYVQYGDLANGMRYGLNAYLTFGARPKVEIGGTKQEASGGLGDAVFAATLFPVAKNWGEGKGLNLATSVFLTLPVGKAALNKVTIAGPSEQITPQIGVEWGLGSGWYVDAATDVTFTRNYRQNGVSFSRDPSYQTQVLLRHQFSPTTAVAGGISSHTGGKLFANGAYTGQKTRKDQLRLFASTFINPTTQLQGMIARDLHVVGGFKSSTEVQLRLARLF